MKPSKFFALAGVISAYEENGATNLAHGWAGIVNQAMHGELSESAYNTLAANGKLHELVVRQTYEDHRHDAD